jgi:hypothetical protein
VCNLSKMSFSAKLIGCGRQELFLELYPEAELTARTGRCGFLPFACEISK